MRRMSLALLGLLVSVAMLTPLSGCGEKKCTTVQQSERRIESEPQMRSPGTEVVE